ncbi:MAG: helix-turn-helix domain-containing protein [Ruminiclostridium sp.]
MILPEMIAELRKDKGLLQKELAQFLGVSIGTVSNYETGVHNPEIETLIKLADYFNVSVDYMLGRVKSKEGLDILNDKIISSNKELTVGEVVSDILTLSEDSKIALIDYLGLLIMKEKQK